MVARLSVLSAGLVARLSVLSAGLVVTTWSTKHMHNTNHD